MQRWRGLLSWLLLLLLQGAAAQLLQSGSGDGLMSSLDAVPG